MAYVFGVDGTEKFIPDEKSYESIQQNYLDELEQWNRSVNQRL